MKSQKRIQLEILAPKSVSSLPMRIQCLMFIFLLGAAACSKPSATAEAHREMVKIQTAMIEQYNSKNSGNLQAGVITVAVDRMDDVDLSQCPDDYQKVWDELVDHWEKWQLALELGDIKQATKFSEQNPAKAEALLKIAQREGFEPEGK